MQRRQSLDIIPYNLNLTQINASTGVEFTFKNIYFQGGSVISRHTQLILHGKSRSVEKLCDSCENFEKTEIHSGGRVPDLTLSNIKEPVKKILCCLSVLITVFLSKLTSELAESIIR